MRILLFTQYYTPEPPLRPCELGPELVERGHEVVALTGFPSYPKGRIYKGYRERGWRWETIDGVRVLRLPVIPDHSESAIRRAAYYCSIALGACVAGPLNGKDFDAAFVYTPPMTLGIPAALTKWCRGVPFVYDIQDIWPESLAATGMVDNLTVLDLFARLDRFNCHQAAAVTVISPGFKRNLIQKGVPATKIHVVPNWADEDVYRPLPRDNALAAQLGLADRFNVLYAGNMGLPQQVGTIIAAAESVRDLTSVQFVLVGDGVQKTELEERVARARLPNVRFLGHRPASEMSAIYALADVLLVHLRKDPLFAITVPSKTIAYLAVGRPILVAVEGDTADVVLGAGAGVACPPEDPIAMAQAVRDLYHMPIERREAMGQAGRRAFLASYTRAGLVDCYEALFTEVARTGRPKLKSIRQTSIRSIP